MYYFFRNASRSVSRKWWRTTKSGHQLYRPDRKCFKGFHFNSFAIFGREVKSAKLVSMVSIQQQEYGMEFERFCFKHFWNSVMQVQNAVPQPALSMFCIKKTFFTSDKYFNRYSINEMGKKRGDFSYIACVFLISIRIKRARIMW